MLLLMTYLEKSADNESLRNYQRDEWGTLDGETCVIELSGIPAHSSIVKRNRERFRKERIEEIRQRMQSYNPELVVMYGLGRKKHWIAIAQGEFPPDNIPKIGPTKIEFTPHPVSCVWTNDDWKQLGERLRREPHRLS